MAKNMKKRLRLLLSMTLFVGVSHISNAQLGRCKGKYLGNIIANTVHSNYSSLWNQTTSENGSKWGTVHRGTNNYSWGNSDLAYNQAKNSGGLFKFHALIWGAQAPGFLANASAAQIETAIRQWYQAVQDHYDPMGGLKLIDVLNEPVNTPINREIANLKAALTLGYQREPANAGDLNNTYGWAIWPFQLARKHFPNAELLINEFNTEHNWNNCRAEYIRMSNAIKNAPNLTDGKKNIIDGIGLQAHGMNGQLNLSAANFKACLDEIWSKTNLPLHITELDLVAEPNEAAQRTKYQEFFTIAWEHPHVAGITLWGYIQGATWIPGNRVSGPGGTDSGIQYANLTDRPAMTWIKEYMASRPSLPCCPAPASFGGCNGNAAPTVSITAPANNATFTAPATVNIAATAADADGTVSRVEFFNGTTKLGEDASSPYTYAWTNVVSGAYNITAVATDNSGNKTTSAIIAIRVNVPQGPYNGTINQIPGTIQAEHFDVGGNTFAYSDDTPGSQVTPVVNFRTNEDVDIEACTDAGGGYNIGWWTSGEWLEYTVNVASTGSYDLDLRVASDGAGKTLTFAIGNTNIASEVVVPNTAGWQTWQTVTTTVQLTAGQHILRVSPGTQSYINFNYMVFKPANVTGLESDQFAGFSLYPNPFNSEGLKIQNKGSFKYQITDMRGVVMEQGQNNQVVGSQLTPGVYMLSLEKEGVVTMHKIVKE